MRTVGVIGGLGPETTAKFYLEINEGCYKKDKETRPPILIWSVPITYKAEADAQIRSRGEESLIPYLIDAARRLEAGGADFIVMPCNSLHSFIGEIRGSVKIPVLSIVEETVKFLKKEKIGRVGLISTSLSIKHRIYHSAFEKEKLVLMEPEESQQSRIGDTINRLVLGEADDKDNDLLHEIIDTFSEKGINYVLLACTDLQLLNPDHSKSRIIDTMKILAEATVEEMLK